MESKKKKNIILIVSCVSLILIIGIIGSFFVVKKINQSSSNTPATNVSTTTQGKLLKATQDIIEGRIPQNYTGNYKFKYICSLEFNEKLNEIVPTKTGCPFAWHSTI